MGGEAVLTLVTPLVLVLCWSVVPVPADVCGDVGNNVTWLDGGHAEIEVWNEKFETRPGLVAGVVYNGE